ncbi:hypothetical protein BKA83DRAFT_4496256 [Pisolithus microcarpus]|nr:hypothetical protein BKA83DRAFT_4496256 [Pisolithus microcarpus]
MSLSGHSQLALSGLNSDVEDNLSDQITSHSTVSSLRSQLIGLTETLRTTQLQLNVEQTHNCELKEQNVILEVNKPKRAKKNVPPELLAYDGEIRILVKKYGPYPVDTPLFTTADCYATVLTEELSLVAELDASLPDHLHRIRNQNSFHDMFVQAMQSGQSNILYKLQDNIEVIFSLPKAYFILNFAQLTITEVIKMLGVKDVGMPSQKFTMWFPFLFKNMKVDMRKPFTNWEPLGLILKMVLWGKVSLAEGFVWCGGPKMNGCKWQVSAVTPGAIAWAVTICMFMLSPDSEFPSNSVGQLSKINYYEVFHGYNEVNSFIFGKSGTTSAKSGSTGPMEDLAAEIDAAMATMDAAALALEDNVDDFINETGPAAASSSGGTQLAPAVIEEHDSSGLEATAAPMLSDEVAAVINPASKTNSRKTSTVSKSTRGRKSTKSKHH